MLGSHASPHWSWSRSASRSRRRRSPQRWASRRRRCPTTWRSSSTAAMSSARRTRPTAARTSSARPRRAAAPSSAEASPAGGHSASSRRTSSAGWKRSSRRSTTSRARSTPLSPSRRPPSRRGSAQRFAGDGDGYRSGMATTTGTRAKPGEKSKLEPGFWRDVLKRTVSEFREDNITDWAAALTYYGMLSVFPALIALVSIVGLIGKSATDPLLDNLGSFAPGPAKEILENSLNGLTESRGGASILFFVGLAGAIWAASSYIGGVLRPPHGLLGRGGSRPALEND